MSVCGQPYAVAEPTSEVMAAPVMRTTLRMEFPSRSAEIICALSSIVRRFIMTLLYGTAHVSVKRKKLDIPNRSRIIGL